MRTHEGSIAEKIVEANQFYHPNSSALGLLNSKVHFVPTADHQMHIDNPVGLARVLINDIYDLDLPIETNPLAQPKRAKSDDHEEALLEMM